MWIPVTAALTITPFEGEAYIWNCFTLAHLADYVDRLTGIFRRHGTRGTWYAHASVGCLHVRPVLNMRNEHGAQQMRAIAEEASEIVREMADAVHALDGSLDGFGRSGARPKRAVKWKTIRA